MMYQHSLVVPSPLLVSQDPGGFTKSLRSPTADLTEDQAGLVAGNNKDEIFLGEGRDVIFSPQVSFFWIFQ